MGRLAILTVAATLALGASTAMAQARSNPPPAQPKAPPLPPPAVIYTMEQIAIQQLTPELQQALQPLRTLQESEEALKVRGVSFIWRRAEVNSASLDANVARQLASLPPHEVFVIPQAQGGAMIGTITQQRPAPAGAAPSPPQPAAKLPAPKTP